MLFPACSSLASPSCRARLTALTVAFSNFLRNDVAMLGFPRPSKPMSSPARTHMCLHRGDLSSAPFTTAIAQSSRLSPRCVKNWLLVASGDSSERITCIAAELKTPRMRIVVWRPSARCHIEGAERSWEVRRDTFNGLDREVSSVVAEIRSLRVVRYNKSEMGTL